MRLSRKSLREGKGGHHAIQLTLAVNQVLRMAWLKRTCYTDWFLCCHKYM